MGLMQTKGGERLLIFTRFPRPGMAKTRLIPALGEEGSAALQRKMTEQTLEVAKSLAGRRDLTLEIRYTGGTSAEINQWLHPGAIFCREQGEGDLGARLQRAFEDTLRGSNRVVAIGCDCPDLSGAILEQAFDRLREKPIVLGPAVDGGYFLLGLSIVQPELFNHMAWGTSQVLAQTIKRIKETGLSYHLLEPLQDVDRPADLIHFRHHPCFQ